MLLLAGGCCISSWSPPSSAPALMIRRLASTLMIYCRPSNILSPVCLAIFDAQLQVTSYMTWLCPPGLKLLLSLLCA